MHSIMKLSLIAILATLFSGCLGLTISPLVVKEHEKVFENEDIYILTALHFEQKRDYQQASGIFGKLYELTNKKEYLYRSLRNDIAASENEKSVKRIDEISDNKHDDFELIRIKISALINMNSLEKARDLALELVMLSNSAEDYILVSDIYVKLKDFDSAMRYLESAYIQNYDEKILEKIAVILYVNLQRKNDAIAQLESHSRIHGCSQFICNKLIGFYSNDNNIDGLLSVYLRLYKMDGSKDIANKIVQIYGYNKDYPKMVEFLEESKGDEELLLQLYIQMKNYKKAAPLSKKLYKETGDVEFLGRSAMFEYESSKNKNDKTMQKSVITKLEEVLETSRDGMYLNYLGYLLIDLGIDVKKGIKYVKEALLQEPNSVYYLDSLAWGYYRLSECEKAAKIIKKVQELGGANNEEVIYHMRMINNCLKNKKVKNRK